MLVLAMKRWGTQLSRRSWRSSRGDSGSRSSVATVCRVAILSILVHEVRLGMDDDMSYRRDVFLHPALNCMKYPSDCVSAPDRVTFSDTLRLPWLLCSPSRQHVGEACVNDSREATLTLADAPYRKTPPPQGPRQHRIWGLDERPL